jgi:hypothetical protein
MRDSFIFYRSFVQAIEDTSPDDFKAIVLAASAYALDGVEPDFSNSLLKMAFNFMKPLIDSNNSKWEEVRKKRVESGRLGGAKTGNQNARKNKQNKQMLEKQAKQAVDVNVDDKVANAPFVVSSETTQSQKDAIELSTLLLMSHRKEIPDYLSGKNDEKTINSWAQDIEKLIRLDGQSPDVIKQVVLWAKTPGGFWFPNIQSGKKLREKYEVLYSQMLSMKNTETSHRSESANGFKQNGMHGFKNALDRFDAEGNEIKSHNGSADRFKFKNALDRFDDEGNPIQPHGNTAIEAHSGAQTAPE